MTMKLIDGFLAAMLPSVITVRGWSGERPDESPFHPRHDQRNFTEDLQRRSSLPLGCRGCGYLRNHFGFHSEWRN